MAAVTTGSADDDDAKALRKFKDEIVTDIVKGYIEPLDQKVTEQSGNVSAIMVTLAEISTTQSTMMEQVAELPKSRSQHKSHLRSGSQLKSMGGGGGGGTQRIRCYNCNEWGHFCP